MSKNITISWKNNYKKAFRSKVSLATYRRKANRCIFQNMSSNSFTIHQVKTKKITTAKEVWIPGLN